MALPALIPIITTALIAVAVPIFVKILLAFGVGFVTYYGVDQLMSYATANMSGYISGLPSDALSILGLGGIDKLLNLVLSGYAAKAVLVGLTGAGTLKKAIFR